MTSIHCLKSSSLYLFVKCDANNSTSNGRNVILCLPEKDKNNIKKKSVILVQVHGKFEWWKKKYLYIK